VLHHLVASGPMVFVYLDALGDDHRRLRALDLDRGRAHLAGIGAAVLARWDVDSICAALGVPGRTQHDARIAAAIRCLDERPQDFARIADLAAIAGLSASRFQALFTDAVGMPFRRYRTWRRMAVVMRALARGSTLTEAAQAAGFSGSSHLSATFRAMFGLTPSRVVRLGLTRALAFGPSMPPGPSRAARGG
jgi:AraC-like DNA-binding protein